MNEKNVYLHHFLLSREFFQYGRKCGESVCHIRKVSEKSLDLAFPVLFEERRDIVKFLSVIIQIYNYFADKQDPCLSL